ncbi:MAG: T9SS type A sorting domain-containing protein [Vicingaceae bacterium]
MVRYLLSFLCIILLSTAYAQQLQNTRWKTVLQGSPDTITVIAQTDTFFVNAPMDSNLVTALFNENADTLSVVDLFGPYSCANPDTGSYIMSISNDTLTLNIIVDFCVTRGVLLDGASLWRDYSLVGIPNQPKEIVRKVYPNPNNGQFWIEVEKPVNLEIVDMAGRSVFTSYLNRGKNTITTNLQAGLYVAVFSNQNSKSSLKLTVLGR